MVNCVRYFLDSSIHILRYTTAALQSNPLPIGDHVGLWTKGEGCRTASQSCHLYYDLQLPVRSTKAIFVPSGDQAKSLSAFSRGLSTPRRHHWQASPGWCHRLSSTKAHRCAGRQFHPPPGTIAGVHICHEDTIRSIASAAQIAGPVVSTAIRLLSGDQDGS